MNFKEFDDLVGKVFLFLGADKPNDTQKEFWFEEVKRIPGGAIPTIYAQLKMRDGVSRRTNIPKVINEIYGKISSAGGGSTIGAVRYDPVEDFRFPIGYMHKGLNVLIEEGELAFANFAEMVGMPKNDRDRVRGKMLAIRASDGGKVSAAEAFDRLARGGDRKENPKKLSEIVPF